MLCCAFGPKPARTLHRLNLSIDLPLDLELFIRAVCTIYKGNKQSHFPFKLSSAREPCVYLFAILSEPGFMSHKFSTTRVRWFLCILLNMDPTFSEALARGPVACCLIRRRLHEGGQHGAVGRSRSIHQYGATNHQSTLDRWTRAECWMGVMRSEFRSWRSSKERRQPWHFSWVWGVRQSYCWVCKPPFRERRPVVCLLVERLKLFPVQDEVHVLTLGHRMIGTYSSVATAEKSP